VRKLIALILLLGLLVGCQPTSQLKPIPEPRPRDGSVVFWHGGLLVRPIYRNTDSTLTHAAIILYMDGEPWVYEAVPPRVRKVSLTQYRQEMKEKGQDDRLKRRDFTWFIMEPCESYTQHQLEAMKRYAESQLGRPYMLRGWWKGREVRGVFCSQFAGDVIEQSGEIRSDHFRESPGGLYKKLVPFYEVVR
jgi:hypothetical protein